ncbi:unnamed protein product [Ectocarpus sp. 6 AP-2014]
MAFEEAFEQIRPSDCRAKMELCDRINDIQSRTFRRDAVMASNTDAMVMATPVAPPTDPGTSVPTPECHAAVRGHEISIGMVSTELGVRIGQKAGMVGRRMKALYAERYGGEAAANIPKRLTIYMGRPYQENTYFSEGQGPSGTSSREVADGVGGWLLPPFDLSSMSSFGVVCVLFSYFCVNAVYIYKAHDAFL